MRRIIMQKVWTIVLILSLLGNIIGLLVAYKAFDYRKKMIAAWSQSNEWLPETSKQYNTGEVVADSVDIIFLGASITADWDLAKFFPGKRYRNMGIDGQFSSQLLLRFQHDIINRHPRAVAIKFCEMNFSNDVPIQLLQENIQMMAKLADGNGIRPIFLSMLPVTAKRDRSRAGEPINARVAEFNRWLSDFSAAHGYLYVDIATPVADGKGNLDPANGKDNVHPNDTGYGKMAEVLSAALGREGY
jgi:lysophospholipase L1-like esterase